ncbi:MAG TPA: hypothetical protein VIE44_03870 [Methylomirabilota bacterium]
MTRQGAAAALAAVLLALGVVGMLWRAEAVGEDAAAEVSEALRNLGSPGVVWGRLAVEEESPVGAWTPLGGIEVTIYPATAGLVAELESIRKSARGSAAQYESAAGRVQAALAAHQRRIDGLTQALGEGLVAEPPLVAKPRFAKAVPPAGTDAARAQGGTRKTGGAAAPSGASAEGAEASHPWRQKTDPAGLFAFDPVPSGDWLLVAVRVSAYSAEKLRAAPKPRQSSRTQNFLPRAAGPAKEAEFWVTRVRVVTGERVGLEITDRARWLVGPVR